MTVSRWVKDQRLPDKENFKELQSYFDWDDKKVQILAEDWFENGLGERTLRIAGADFVEAKYGGNYLNFLEHIIALDEEAIVGINKEHEGTPEQWAPIFQESPYTWKLIVLGDEVVGYWQFMCLKPEYYQKVVSGEIIDSEVSVEMMEYPVVAGRYNVFFCVLAIKRAFQGTQAHALIEKSLVGCIRDFTSHGVFFENMYSCGFTHEGIRMCQKIMKMRHLGRHPRAGKAEVAERCEISGLEIARSHWGRNQAIMTGYRDEFG